MRFVDVALWRRVAGKRWRYDVMPGDKLPFWRGKREPMDGQDVKNTYAIT